MSSQKKKNLKLIGVLLIMLGLVFSLISFKRFLLPYNDMGNYFDAYEGITYNLQAILTYVILAFAFLGTGLIVLLHQLK